MKMKKEIKAAIATKDKQIRKYERLFREYINKELRKFYKKCASMVGTSQLEKYIKIELLTYEHQRRLEKLMTVHYTHVIRAGTDFMQEVYKSDIPNMERKALNIYRSLLQKYVSENLLKKATSISNNSKRRVLEALSKAVNEGLPPDAQAGKIATLARISKPRAGLIARTETFSALTFSQLESAKVYADEFNVVKYKKWFAFQDDRVRETHDTSLNPELLIARPLDEPFIVGGYECDRPHDASLPPEEVINCRCDLLFVNSPDE